MYHRNTIHTEICWLVLYIFLYVKHNEGDVEVIILFVLCGKFMHLVLCLARNGTSFVKYAIPDARLQSGNSWNGTFFSSKQQLLICVSGMGIAIGMPE